MVEQGIENPRVGGSSPSLATIDTPRDRSLWPVVVRSWVIPHHSAPASRSIIQPPEPDFFKNLAPVREVGFVFNDSRFSTY